MSYDLSLKVSPITAADFKAKKERNPYQYHNLLNENSQKENDISSEQESKFKKVLNALRKEEESKENSVAIPSNITEENILPATFLGYLNSDEFMKTRVKKKY